MPDYHDSDEDMDPEKLVTSYKGSTITFSKEEEEEMLGISPTQGILSPQNSVVSTFGKVSITGTNNSEPAGRGRGKKKK